MSFKVLGRELYSWHSHSILCIGSHWDKAYLSIHDYWRFWLLIEDFCLILFLQRHRNILDTIGLAVWNASITYLIYVSGMWHFPINILHLAPGRYPLFRCQAKSPLETFDPFLLLLSWVRGIVDFSLWCNFLYHLARIAFWMVALLLLMWCPCSCDVHHMIVSFMHSHINLCTGSVSFVELML